MYCHNCGNKLNDGANFCPNCGEKVMSPASAPLAGTPPVQEQQAAQPAPGNVQTEAVQRPQNIDITVSAQQLMEGQLAEVSDPSLPAKFQIRLTPQMRDGMQLRLRIPGMEEPVMATLHVTRPAAPTFAAMPVNSLFPEPPKAPEAPGFAGIQAPQRTAQPQPAAQQTYTQQPAGYSAPASGTAVTVRCSFQLCTVAELNKFKLGRKYEDGNVDVYSDRLEIFRKSSFVGAAFGMIGSALEGKGKAVSVVTRPQIANFENLVDLNGRRIGYRMLLADGRYLLINPARSKSRESYTAIDSFLRN